MTKMYCASCGNEVTKNDKFCFNCGAKVDSGKNIRNKTNLYEAPIGSQPVKQEVVYEETKSKRRIPKKAITIPLIIIGIMLVPMIVMGTLSAIRFDIGSLDYSVDDPTITDIDLDIYNALGSITVNFDDSITSVFEATINVRGGLRAEIEDAINFEHSVIGNVADINFNYESVFNNFFNLKALSYNIVIDINPDIVTDIDIEAGTGGIDVYAENLDNVEVKDLFLSSSTGSVHFYGENLNNVSIGEVNISSSTGGVTFNLEDSMNSTVEDLTMNTSTGSVRADLGLYTEILDSDISLSTSTGSITVIYEDLFTPQDFTWTIETSTGSITLDITQEVIMPGNSTMTFNVETSTGSIDLDGLFDEDIGIEISATTSTGSITLPNDHDYYISPNYNLKNSQYSFNLVTSTGSITGSI